MPLSRAFMHAKFSARGLVSVATTCSECAAASNAWMPAPVPTSSVVFTLFRNVSRVREIDDGLVPLITKSPGSDSPSGGRESLKRKKLRHGSNFATARTPSPARTTRPLSIKCSILAGSRALLRGFFARGAPEDEQADQRVKRRGFSRAPESTLNVDHAIVSAFKNLFDSLFLKSGPAKRLSQQETRRLFDRAGRARVQQSVSLSCPRVDSPENSGAHCL